jgi:pyruvate/2-oxoglutarate dehydrogenase complex dihydrolipoamide dehydrogenase (E3) component
VGTYVLLTVGRTPNTSDLGLDRAGVATDHRGYIVVDDQLQTNVPGIWALGDCNGRGTFTHTSYNDYEIVADNLFVADHRRVSDRTQAYALYIDPPLGRCSMTDAEIRKSGRSAHLYDPSESVSYPANGRTLTDDAIDVFLPILTNGKVIGDNVGHHTDLLASFPYIGAPHKVRSAKLAAA